VEYKAYDHPEIWRAITAEEYVEAINWALEYGLTNLDPRSVAVYNVYAREQISNLKMRQ
jgi:hypothetical protein